jgi:hypothetical protein
MYDKSRLKSLLDKASAIFYESHKDDELPRDREIIREADAELIDSFPAPAIGRLVLVSRPSTSVESSLLDGGELPPDQNEHLALAWTDENGHEIVRSTDGFLVGSCHAQAQWLPDSWEMEVFPAGWTLPHLEAWFTYAIRVARIPDRPDLTGRSNPDQADIPNPRGLVAHAHLILRHLAIPASPKEPKIAIDQPGCIAELREVWEFIRNAVPPIHCEEHLPAFDGVHDCLSYLKQVTPSWPKMNIDWPLVLADAEKHFSISSADSEAHQDQPSPGQELSEFLGSFVTNEEIASTDPFSRGYAYGSLLLELVLQLQAFCAASLAFGYDLDAIPSGSTKLTPFHALMCIGWPIAEMVQVVRLICEADLKAVQFESDTPVQLGSSFGKNCHDAILNLANEICNLKSSATEGKLAVASLENEQPGTIEHAWAKFSATLEGRLPDAQTVKRTQIQLGVESRKAFAETYPSGFLTPPPTQSQEPSGYTRQTKRSTVKGEGQLKLLASLLKHHRYAEKDSLNQTPIGNNELARQAGVADSTAHSFFAKEFKGHVNYRRICMDENKLCAALKLLNKDFRPALLLDRPPSDTTLANNG